MEFLAANVPGVEQAIISVHCHDDLGMATANTLAAVRAGHDKLK
jgi:2-isopropylmalate synthase